jgi:hypothetical protein
MDYDEHDGKYPKPNGARDLHLGHSARFVAPELGLLASDLLSDQDHEEDGDGAHDDEVSRWNHDVKYQSYESRVHDGDAEDDEEQ